MNDFTDAILHLEKYREKLTSSENSVKLKTTTWLSDWLLSDFYSEIWVLKTFASYRDKKTRKWKKTLPIYWDVTLPNGNKLTDKIYTSILYTIRKMVFLSRQGYTFSPNAKTGRPETTRSQQQSDIARSLILIVKWMITKGYHPELYGFKVLTEIDINQITLEAKFGTQVIDGTLHVIENHLEKEKRKNNLSRYIKDGRINYSKITKELGLKKGDGTPITPSPRLQSMLNKKWETAELPEWLDYKYSKGREYPSHRAQKFIDAVNEPTSISSLMSLLTGFRIIGRFASLFHEELGGLGWCEDLNTTELGKTYAYKEKRRTPTIPTKTALEYLDTSIAWIVDIGPQLIKAKNICDEQLKSMMKANTSRKDYFANKIILPFNSIPSSNYRSYGININRYHTNPTGTSHGHIRNNLSIEEAVECLVAACFIVISTFSCKRIDEILNLTVSSSRPALDGGWELVFGLKKASAVEALSLIGRPIPDIAQMAIDHLIDLRPKDIEYRGNNYDDEPLFLSSYKINKSTHKTSQRDSSKIYRSLELFADVVQISLNPKGQRWYIRSHECRRFFAISYFWHDRFSSLEALSWFMGHDGIEATMHYVTEETIASELPEEEARFTAALIHEEQEESIYGLSKLANDARDHFHTDNLSIIDKANLEDYLKLRFNQGYRVIKYGFKTQIIYLEEYNDN